MALKLTYAIKFVADMDRAVKFYRDTLGLTLKHQSSEWSEFSTGETSLALHKASEKNPAGSVELGLNVENIQAFYKEMTGKGVKFPQAPTMQQYGELLAQFVDSEGGRCSVSGK